MIEKTNNYIQKIYYLLYFITIIILSDTVFIVVIRKQIKIINMNNIDTDI